MAESTSVSEKEPVPVGSSDSGRPGGLKRFLKASLKIVAALVVLLALVGAYVYFYVVMPTHSTPHEVAKPIAASGDETLDSIRRGTEYLRIHQEADGNFAKGMMKGAITALVLDGLARTPDKLRLDTPFVKKAMDAVRATRQPDGSFGIPQMQLQTYSTAVAILAMASMEDPSLQSEIDGAQKYLRTTQDNDSDSMSEGGAGYHTGGNASGDVTHNWVEAMRAAGVKPDDPAMQKAKLFFSRCQNSEDNKLQPDGFGKSDDGGSYYGPGKSNAGYDVKDGKKIPRSYGLMTYASLKAFLYMNAKKDDNEVQSSMKWVRSNYTLDENKNLGADGLYYYYLTMAKALYAYGDGEIKTIDGQSHRWAEELSKRLISLQAPDGSWHNSVSSQWMENDNVLVTGYAIRTLTICHDELQREKHMNAVGETPPAAAPAPAQSNNDAKKPEEPSK